MAPPTVGRTSPAVAPRAQATSTARPVAAPPAAPAPASTRPPRRSSSFQAVGPAARPAPPPPFTALGKNLAGVTGSQVMPSKSGPIPAAAWDNPTEIVGNLRQDTGRPGDVSGDDRCGPTNLLAAALLQGKGKAAAFLAAEAKSPNLSAPQKAKLAEIGKAVANGTASYDQLNEATALMYQAANTRFTLNEAKADPAFNVSNLNPRELDKFRALAHKDPARLNAAEQKELGKLLTLATGKESTVEVSDDPRGGGKKVAFVKITSSRPGDSSGLDDGELAAFAKTGGLTIKSKGIDAAGAADGDEVTGTLLSKLRKGEATVLRVGLTSQDSTANHFVTVGKLPDGRPYIYNPSPGGGDSTLIIGSQHEPQPQEFIDGQDALDRRIRTDQDGATPRTLKVK